MVLVLEACSKSSLVSTSQITPSKRLSVSLGSVFSPKVKSLSALKKTGRNERKFSTTIRSAKNQDFDQVVEKALKTGKDGLEFATGLVPESVPRPVAKAGVVVGGILVVTTLVKTIFSTIITFLLLGGLGYGAFLYLTKNESSGSKSDEDSNDPIEQARKIMDKYK